MKKIKIAIVVQGRFYAFDLARALIGKGHEVILFTNYPKFIVKKWGVPVEAVRSCLLHGIVCRLISILKMNRVIGSEFCERATHIWFSKWGLRGIKREKFDVVSVFSGVAEEIFRGMQDGKVLKVLIRGSSHIRTQYEILSYEERRVKEKIDKPSKWIISREEREYGLADKIKVLSTFAARSLVDKGVHEEKIFMCPLATEWEKFKASREDKEKRKKRVLSGKTLRVLTVGTFSFRKGIYDLEKIVGALGREFIFRFVGHVPKEGEATARSIKGAIQMVPKIAEKDLKYHYAWADMFIFPTIEDGFPAVLSQAQSAGLPIIATVNCSGPDIIKNDHTGWVMSIRDPGSFIDRLRWCDKNREGLARVIDNVQNISSKITWSDVADSFVSNIDLKKRV